MLLFTVVGSAVADVELWLLFYSYCADVDIGGGGAATAGATAGDNNDADAGADTDAARSDGSALSQREAISDGVSKFKKNTVGFNQFLTVRATKLKKSEAKDGV